MENRTSPWPVWIATAAVALMIASYAPSTIGGFFSDDHVYVVGNQRLQSFEAWDAGRLFVERTNAFEFLPVRDLSYLADMTVFGLQPFGYHLPNLLL